jgi:hypothetical protein
MIIGVRSNDDSFQVAFDALQANTVLTATFASIKANITDRQCLSCHNATNASGGVRYDNYADATSARSVTIGTPASSRLYVTSLGANASMTTGKGKGALTAAESKAILDWITAGALNN